MYSSIYKDTDKTSSIIGSVSGSGSSRKKPLVIYLDENGNECNEQRVRKVDRSHLRSRHITVVSYSRKHRESHTHTQHHVTTVSFPQRFDRSSPGSYSPYSLNYQGSDSSFGFPSNQSYSPQLHSHHLHAFGHHNASSSPAHQQQQQQSSPHFGNHIQKRTSIRSGSSQNSNESTKRNHRHNNQGYELSQDLIDKQIELLERKYGGRVKAQHAALVIQRAFRRYMLNKKFASIRANANSKVDKRTTKNGLQRLSQSQSMEINNQQHQLNSLYGQQQQHQHNNSAMPTRNLAALASSTTPIKNPGPALKSTPIQHPYVNLMHQQYQQPTFYNVAASIASPSSYQLQYQSNNNLSFGSNNNSYVNANDSSLSNTYNAVDPNQSWNPTMVHYTAAQIYMRPKSSNSTNNLSYQNSPTASNTSINKKPPPPEVPKRTSSVISTGSAGSGHRKSNGGLMRSTNNGSVCSVQSSGSESSSVSAEKIHYDNLSERGTSPSMWNVKPKDDDIRPNQMTNDNFKMSETIRKRKYRLGLNLFNKKPEKGIDFLVKMGFLENTPSGVAKFLISRKGLSRQMIGEYLGMIQQTFNQAVLDSFCGELDLSGQAVDVALRKFQSYFRMPGEAQKIERLMEKFANRYCECNPDVISRLRTKETVFVLAFAIIMLNTDLHTPNLKAERRMKCDDFIKNLRGVDDTQDIDRDMLMGIYERIKINEFKSASDHVTQVMKVQSTIIGKKPNLALQHRRLVCYCRLYEIPDLNRKERIGLHQREVFLFNDILVITKIFNKKKSSVTYSFRMSLNLHGKSVKLLKSSNYPHSIQISQKLDNKVLITFNARNEHDRVKFAQDLEESIAEMDEMEQIRIETEMDKKSKSRNSRSLKASMENRDSGYAETEQILATSISSNDFQHLPRNKNALSNSLLDINEPFASEKTHQRRCSVGSIGSLDSGAGVSFNSSNGTRCSDNKLRIKTSYPTLLPNQSYTGRSTEV